MRRHYAFPLAPHVGVNRWDLVAAALAIGAIAFVAAAVQPMRTPLAALEAAQVSLDPSRLPSYALHTTFRMFAALAVSLVFSLAVGTLAARSARARSILLPLLDVGQSVPVLGYLSITVVAFLRLFPGSALGAELAAIFAIFTSQVWNITFSVYQSMRTVPAELAEAARSMRMSAWQRFWHLDVPFATPGLVWNMMVSMSGAWFFVVASEAIVVGSWHLPLPGIGSYLAQAIAERNLAAVGWALVAMMLVIALYDTLMFRPLVAWSDKFRLGAARAGAAPRSWVLSVWRQTRALRRLGTGLRSLLQRATLNRSARASRRRRALRSAGAVPRLPAGVRAAAGAVAWWLALAALAAALLFNGWRFLSGVDANEWLHVFLLGCASLGRVLSVTLLAVLVWVPIGMWIGLRPNWTARIQPLVQYLAAVPANLFYPLAVFVIVRWQLNHDLWLSPLVVLGAQWYILFNVIAGTSAIPQDLLQVSSNLQLGRWLRWRRVLLPAIAPYIVTGALTAWGGAWNATIVAEVVHWGDQRLVAHGLGAYITVNTEAGDYTRIALGVTMMSAFVVFFNRLFWRPMYNAMERRFRLG
ncbi:MAG: ABC transporter permease subunit [Burkholderiaceae bacterium]|nr:ABC transporter permease subunit [Burkholderiaceae bacterium]